MLVIGHRGASGHALENTLDAFERCVAPSPTACDGVELDVHTTADGELVVHHDRAIADDPPLGLSVHDTFIPPILSNSVV